MTQGKGTLRRPHPVLSPLRALALFVCLGVLWGSPQARAEAPAGPGWQSLREAPVTFHFRAKDRGIAQALAAQTPGRVTAIHETAGLAIPPHIDVVLASTFEEFSAAQPGSPPSWAAGTAYAERSEIYLRSRMPRVGVDPIDQVYVHELVHILLGRSFVGASPPRWLNEGLARLLAHEFRPAEQMELTRAALAGGLLSLESLTEGWPSRAGRASLAYAQSVDFTAYLGDMGTEVLPALIGRLASGEELDSALVGVTGSGLAELEEAWSRRIGFWHAFLPVVGGSGFLWGLASAIFGVAAFRKRRSVRQRIADMPTGDPAPVRTRSVVVEGEGPEAPRPPRPAHDLSAIFGVATIQPAAPPGEGDDEEPLLH